MSELKMKAAMVMEDFSYDGTPIRTVMLDGEPWWVLADVCRVLKIENTRNVAARLDDDEKGAQHMDTLGGPQAMTIINESGLYKVILRSNKPEAKKFTRWITSKLHPIHPKKVEKRSVVEENQPVMDGEMQVFLYDGSQIRTVLRDGELWWVLADVCKVLNLTNSRMTVTQLDEDEKGVSQIYTLGGPQAMTIINESGLYKVILRSDKPEAKKFAYWITSKLHPIHPKKVEKRSVVEENQPIMDGEMQIFLYDGKPIRTVLRDGEPWWVLADVCKVLDIVNPTDVWKRLDEDERARFNLGRQGEATIINEFGLYNVILRSNKPEVKAFKRWITHEVLPSIRKHGAYVTPDTLEKLIASPEFGIKLLTALQHEREARKTLEEEIALAKPKVLFADAVGISPDTILIGELAKILKQNGIETGQNRLFAWMRDNGYLMRRQSTDYNMPTQRAMEMGLFRIKETVGIRSDGHTGISKTVKVTGKGQQYFVGTFLSDL